MRLNFEKIQENEFFEKREELLKNLKFDSYLDLKAAIKFHTCLPESKNFVKKLKKGIKENKILTQIATNSTLLEHQIEQLLTLKEKNEIDFFSISVDSYTKENKFENAEKGIKESEKNNRSMLNGFPLVSYGIQKTRKIINEIDAPMQLKHGSTNPKILVEMALASGFSSIEGGAISHNIPLSKSVNLEESIKNWKYVDRLVAFYEECGISIHRESNALLTATLVPPAISNSIQILEALLAMEQGVKNISLASVHYGNLIQDIASIEALKEDMKFYCEEFAFDDININTVFYQWVGGFNNNAMKTYSLLSYGTFTAIMSKVDRIILRNPEDFSSNYLDISLTNTVELTKSMLKMNFYKEKQNLLGIYVEKEQIRKETKEIIEKVIELSEGNLSKGIIRAFELGYIDIPFAPSKYNLGKMMPVRDSEGMIRYLDCGNLPFSEETKKFNKEKIKIRAKLENKEPSFQMTVDDIFALSNGEVLSKK